MSKYLKIKASNLSTKLTIKWLQLAHIRK